MPGSPACEPLLPFEDSRRLTGINLYFAGTGAVLDCIEPLDAALIEAWRQRVERASRRLGWSEKQSVARRHQGGVTLAIAAPPDQLFLATEVNEWALCAALAQRSPGRRAALEAQLAAQAEQLERAEAAADDPQEAPQQATRGPLPVIDDADALTRFDALCARQQRPLLRALLGAAALRGLPCELDDGDLTLGSGVGGRTFELASLPSVDDVAWQSLRSVPTAVVTGSNGKTTTVRLLAACARRHGWHAAYSCTDGVFLDDEALAVGDYSGPAGARRVMRETRAEAAILETARGGILRRGLAVSQADVAIVTNVSADHFGEYGIDDLADLARVKFTVAAAVQPQGFLILNAADEASRAHLGDALARLRPGAQIGYFCPAPAGTEFWSSSGTNSAARCAPRDSRLWLHFGGLEHDLGSIAAMPLSMGGRALYNIANLAGAALAAAALGIPPPTIAAVFADFGGSMKDNPGRLMRFEWRGVTVLIDYAHNPEGLQGFLEVAESLRGPAARLGLILGQAGNRNDADIEALARAAATFGPDLLVLKENQAQLRGRSAGEVPRLLRAELKRCGFPDAALPMENSELDAARHALGWARPGDVLALPLHSAQARNEVIDLLEQTRDD